MKFLEEFVSEVQINCIEYFLAPGIFFKYLYTLMTNNLLRIRLAF